MDKWHVPNSADGKICKHCKLRHESGKADPCIGEFLPGIAHACCGHGDVEKAWCNGFPGCRPGEAVNDFDAPHFVSQLLGEFDDDGNLIKVYINPEYNNETAKNNLKKGFWEKKGQKALDYMKSLKEKQ